MAMSVGSLFANLELDSSEYLAKLRQAEAVTRAQLRKSAAAVEKAAAAMNAARGQEVRAVQAVENATASLANAQQGAVKSSAALRGASERLASAQTGYLRSLQGTTQASRKQEVAQRNLASANESVTQAQQQQRIASEQLTAARQRSTTASRAQTAATRQATQATTAQRQAMDAVVRSSNANAAATLRQRQAQENLTRVQRTGRASAAQLMAAEQRLERATLAQTQAAQKLTVQRQRARTADEAAATAKNRLRAATRESAVAERSLTAVARQAKLATDALAAAKRSQTTASRQATAASNAARQAKTAENKATRELEAAQRALKLAKDGDVAASNRVAAAERALTTAKNASAAASRKAAGAANAHAAATRNYQAEAMRAKAQIASLSTAVRNLASMKSTTLHVNADTALALAKLKRLMGFSNKTISIKADADTETATVKLNGLMKATQQADRKARRAARSFWSMGAQAVTATPRIGLLAIALLGVPAAAFAAAAGAAALYLGMEGIKAAANTAVPALNRLKASVSATFQKGLTPVFQRLANVLIPGVTGGMNAIARAMSMVAAQVTGVITSFAGMRVINYMLSQTAYLIRLLAPAAANFTRGLLILAQVGASTFGQLGRMVQGVAIHFRKMAAQLASSGLLKTALRELIRFIGLIMHALIALAPFLIQAGRLFMAIATPIIQALVPTLQMLTPLFAFLTGLLQRFRPQIVMILQVLFPLIIAMSLWKKGVHLVLTAMHILVPILKIVKFAFVALRFAMMFLLTPVGLIIAAVVGIVAAFVILWRRSAAFRNFWIMIWNQIKMIALWVWNNALKPVFNALGMAIQWIIRNWRLLSTILLLILGPIGWIILAIWKLVTNWRTVWNFIRGILMTVWTTVIRPVFNAFRIAINAVVRAALWLGNGFRIAWNAVVAAAKWAWFTILKPVFDGIWLAIRIIGAVLWVAFALPFQVAWNVISAAARWAWNTVLHPIFNAIGVVVRWLWNNVIRPVFNAIGFAFRNMGLFFRLTYNAVLRPVFDAFAAAGRWLWNNVLRPVFNFIRAGWNNMVRGIQIIWANVLRPAWNAVAAAARWLWNNALRPVFNFIGTAWTALVVGIRALWNRILRPAWNAVAAMGRWLWNNVLRPVFNAIGRAWGALMNGIRWVWNNILRPAWNAIQAAARFMWNRVLRPIFRAIEAGWRTRMVGIRAIWNRILRPCWNAIQAAARFLWNRVLKPIWGAMQAGWDGLLNGMKAVWERVLRPAFNAIKKAINSVGQVFDNVSTWIRDAWDRIKEWAKAPIQWVIDVVWNDGVVKLWNGVAKKFGLGELKPFHLNSGGPVPGYAKGGAVGGVGPDRDKVPAMLTPGEYVLSRQAVAGMGGLGAVDKMHSQAKQRWNRQTRNATGAPPNNFQPGGGGTRHQRAMSGQTLANIVRRMFPNATITSTKRNYGNDFHTSGNAVDFVTPNMVASFYRLAEKYPNSSELFHTAAAWNIDNGRRIAPFPNHYDHIHWAMAGMQGGSKGGPLGSRIWDAIVGFINKIRKIISQIVNKRFKGLNGVEGSGDWAKAIRMAPKGMLEGAIRWLTSMFSGGGGRSVAGAKPAMQWRGVVQQALRMLGYPLSWTMPTLQQIGIESGGNPNAVNRWDSNAAKGTPSKGLLQTIGPTFRANMFPGHGNILAPLDNILAALRYTVRKYGSVPAKWPTRGGYDAGGWLEPGTTYAANKTGKPEAVLTNEQWRAVMGGGLGEKHYHLTVVQAGNSSTNLKEQFRKMEILSGV